MMAASVLRGTPVAAKPQIFTRGKKVVTSAKLGNWLPGSDTPAYLENVTGSYGFDPLGLAATPAALQRFRESEVYHCRWAMLGVVGALGVEVLGYGNWYDAPLPLINGGHATYFGAEIPFDLGTLIAVELAGFAAAETIRGAGEPEARIYPGGAFDPVGLSKGDNVEEWKVKEIKNGRLAMLAFIGFVAAHAAGQGSPLEALAAHLANPAAANFATNGVSLPF